MTRSPLFRADTTLLARLNEAIAAGTLKNHQHHRVAEPLCDALVNADGTLAYPIKEGMIVLIAGEAIEVPVTSDK